VAGIVLLMMGLQKVEVQEVTNRVNELKEEKIAHLEKPVGKKKRKKKKMLQFSILVVFGDEGVE